MIRSLAALVLVLLLAAAAAAVPDCRPGELLVLPHPDHPLAVTAGGKAATTDPALSAALAALGVEAAAAVRIPHTTPGGAVLLRGDPAKCDPVAAARDLVRRGLVRGASPNYRLQLMALPNDPYLSTQWHVQDAGDADIDLPEAWDMATGDPGTVIAILDTGFDWSHPDLQADAWTNPGEVPGNGLDDDGNGYVDDVYGWDFGDGDNDARPDPYFEQGVDVGFHGTHCAGIAGAVTNNGTGIAGAGWQCRIMGLKLNNAAGEITVAGLTNALAYAVDNGAAVVSMSFGGAYEDFQFMETLIDDAIAQAGLVFVAAAGNSGDDTMFYPAAFPGVIAVGATNQQNQRASFSTYGDWVDVAAPGERIWSTVQTNYEWDFTTALLFMLSYDWDGVNPYMYSDGTSMACPLVAGVCGLVKSLRPELNGLQVRDLLVATGDSLAFDQPVGVKVNAAAAVAAVLSTGAPGAVPAPLADLRVSPNPFNPRTVVSFVLERPAQVEAAVCDLRGRRLRTLATGELAAGRHALTWDGRDAAGRALASGTYLLRLQADGRTEVRKLLLAR